MTTSAATEGEAVGPIIPAKLRLGVVTSDLGMARAVGRALAGAPVTWVVVERDPSAPELVAGGLDVVLVDGTSAEHGHVLDRLAAVREVAPLGVIVLTRKLEPRHVRALLARPAPRLDSIVALGDSWRPDLVGEVARVYGAAARSRVLDVVSERLPAPVRQLASVSLDLLPARTSVESVARSMGVSARTVRRRLRAAGLGPAAEFFREIRCLLAWSYLRHGMSVATAARAVGLSKPDTLRRAFREVFDLTPTEARRRAPGPPTWDPRADPPGAAGPPTASDPGATAQPGRTSV